MAMKAMLAIGLTALVATVSLQAKETPAQTAARDAANRAFVLKHYPPRARAAGEQGRVFFKITLDRDGRLRSCEVTKSSGYPRLDEETCELMVTHGVFKRVKDESGLVKNPVHHGAINWELALGGASEAAPQQLASAAKPDKLICRRLTKSGSLAMTERRCLTAREWDQGDEYARDEVRRLQTSIPPPRN
jgi:TonB family protein